VLRPNYRGSTGYGMPFMHVERGDMGGGDLKGVVAAKDFLVATGYVNPDRVGITGASAGGWLTMLALGKYPDVFKAGVQVVPCPR
jgi:dipeptidyl aminopeptidase/acylaminoacyl peptidase